DGDVDLALGRTYLAGIPVYNCWPRLDSVLDGGHRGNNCCLLRRLLLLLVRDAGEYGVTRAVAVVGHTLAAHLIGQTVERLHLLDGMAVGGIDRLADT